MDAQNYGDFPVFLPADVDAARWCTTRAERACSGCWPSEARTKEDKAAAA